jgi:hypothetical protein
VTIECVAGTARFGNEITHVLFRLTVDGKRRRRALIMAVGSLCFCSVSHQRPAAASAALVGRGIRSPFAITASRRVDEAGRR